MGACSIPGVSTFCGAVSSATNAIAGDFIQTAAEDAAKAADSLLKTLATAWTSIPTPTGANCSSGAGGSYTCQNATSSSGGSAGAIQFIQGDLKYITLFVGVAAIIVAAAQMAYKGRGEPVRESMHGLLRLVVVSGAGLAFISILAQAGDSFSSYVLSSTPSSKSGDLAQATSLFKLSGGGTAFTGVAFLLLLLGILAILATLIQLFLIIIRGALLVVMAGVWPLSAAASMTGGGQSMFKKTTGYILAFLIYKPAASIVYALAFYLIQNPPANADPLVTQIEGVVLILLATLTLPALLKFVVPAVSSAGGVGAAEAIGAGAALATGAAAIAATGGGSAAAGAGAGGGSMAATAGPPGATALADTGGAGGPGGSKGPAGPPSGDRNDGDGGGTGAMAEEAIGGAEPGADGADVGAGSGPGGGNGHGSGPGGDGPSGSGGVSNAPGGGASNGSKARSAQQAGQSFGQANEAASGALERQMGDGEEDA
ncbi:MAG: hypothetical protein M3021_10500 [Actinomycetota bacterium]|nr:hypothetical protein [Actinomycetota bacterium]